MANERIRVEGLSKKYGEVYALKNLSFSLEKGEVIGVFGLNGSGKSTLLDIVALAARPDGGRLLYEGREPGRALGSIRRRIGYVPQEIALFEELTVRENLLCWSRLPGKAAKQRADEIAERLNLTAFYNKKVSALSGGMKRRVNLAVALLGEPELLVLDEPFAGVDTDNTDGVRTVLRQMADEGVTEIVSGHAPEQLLPLIDRILVLSKGECVWYGTKADFLAQTGAGGVATGMQRLIRGEGL